MPKLEFSQACVMAREQLSNTHFIKMSLFLLELQIGIYRDVRTARSAIVLSTFSKVAPAAQAKKQRFFLGTFSLRLLRQRKSG